jgi:hypothetical protein
VSESAEFTLQLINKISAPARQMRKAVGDIDRALRGVRDSTGRLRDTRGRFIATSRAADLVAKSMAKVKSGIGAASRALGPLKSGLGGVMAAAGAAGAALGIGLGVKGLVSLNSEFEDTQNQMAGFLFALGEAGDFNSALSMAADTMALIRKDSAILPGEASDYIQIFKSGLPVVQRAIGGSIQEMTAFTNRFAAVTSTLGIDSQQAAMDLRRLLQLGRGGAGVDVRSFTELLPFLQKVEGQAGLTADKFNQMSEAARGKLLTDALKQLDPMLENAASSWTAISGTIKSTAGELFRLSGGSFFQALKPALSALNDIFMDAEGKPTKLGEEMISVFSGMGKMFGDLLKDVVPLVGVFAESFTEGLKAAAPILKENVGALRDLVKLDAFRKGIEVAGKVAGFLVGFVPSAVTALMSIGGALVTLWGTFATVVPRIPQLIQNAFLDVQMFFETFGTRMQNLGSNIVVGLIDGIDSMLGSLKAKAIAMGEAVLGPFKGVLKIFSPSRVMERLGAFTSEGLAIGIDANLDVVRNASRDMGAAVLHPMGVEGQTATVQGVTADVAHGVLGGVEAGSGASGPSVGDISIQVSVGAAPAGSTPEQLGESVAVRVRRELESLLDGAALAAGT